LEEEATVRDVRFIMDWKPSMEASDTQPLILKSVSAVQYPSRRDVNSGLATMDSLVMAGRQDSRRDETLFVSLETERVPIDAGSSPI
jgi:hypothetical protein